MSKSNLQRLWSACDSISTLAAIEREWRFHVGDAFSQLRKWLHPLAEHASLYPATANPTDEQYPVVKHAPDDFVAVPSDGGPVLALTPQDVIVYRLDVERLSEAICSALEFEPNYESCDGLSGLAQVGLFRPYAGINFAAFLVLGGSRQRLTNVVEGLLSRVTTRFILLVASRKTLSMALQLLLGERHIVVLPLDEALEADTNGKWQASAWGTGRLDELRQEALPSLETVLGPAFPTPPNATWADVDLEVIDEHHVRVSIGRTSRVYSFMEMSLADARSGRPNSQWRLLLELATRRGVIHRPKGSATEKIKKSRQKLSDRLQELLGVKDAPITADKHEIKTRFNIRRS
jgi:hypothetical protein